jgi:hypothetical protein
MTVLLILKLLLQLAALFARQAERKDIEKALLHDIEALSDDKADAAARARDDVASGRVQPDAEDPHRRD